MKMSVRDIPGRVILDTSVLNFNLEHGGRIFESERPSNNLSQRTKDDVIALYNIFGVGERASWQLAISPFTYKEIISIQDASERYYLKNWFKDVWDYWLSVLEEDDDSPSFREAEQLKIRLLSSGALDALPDMEDRVLICDALAYNCDCFCTRDFRTILKHRKELDPLSIQILTPTEWWGSIKPYARLWV
jgi:hypothetical protein